MVTGTCAIRDNLPHNKSSGEHYGKFVVWNVGYTSVCNADNVRANADLTDLSTYRPTLCLSNFNSVTNPQKFSRFPKNKKIKRVKVPLLAV